VRVRKPWRPWAPWRIVFRRAEAAHRVQLLTSESGESPVWTLFPYRAAREGVGVPLSQRLAALA
jgi:hypothetical protein